MLEDLEIILKQCAVENFEDDKPNFTRDYSSIDGIGCYLSTPQNLPIVIRKVSDLFEKIKQITPEFTLTLNGEVIDESWKVDQIYKGAIIKVYSKSMKHAKTGGQGHSHITKNSTQKLKHNKRFLSELSDLISNHVDDIDYKTVVFNSLKGALDKV